jgi:hypothetical protein
VFLGSRRACEHFQWSFLLSDKTIGDYSLLIFVDPDSIIGMQSSRFFGRPEGFVDLGPQLSRGKPCVAIVGLNQCMTATFRSKKNGHHTKQHANPNCAHGKSSSKGQQQTYSIGDQNNGPILWSINCSRCLYPKVQFLRFRKQLPDSQPGSLHLKILQQQLAHDILSFFQFRDE